VASHRERMHDAGGTNRRRGLAGSRRAVG
jgi:hypothetical protein